MKRLILVVLLGATLVWTSDETFGGRGGGRGGGGGGGGRGAGGAKPQRSLARQDIAPSPALLGSAQ